MKRDEVRNDIMSHELHSRSCAHADDLVAYLYGEANETEARDFQVHASTCSDCRAELTAFADVRGGIVAWRNEALHPIASLAPDSLRQRVVADAMTKRSALVALREFFSLSPLWLKGATAFATVLLVALLFVTALRFFDRSEAPVAQQAPSVSPIERKELVVAKEKAEPVVVSPAVDSVNPGPTSGIHQTQRTEPRKASRKKATSGTDAPVLSNEERNQLTDLLIASNEDEESVPRLYDLLYESN